MEVITDLLERNDLLVAFVVVGALMLISGYLSKTLTRGRLQGSAIAIIFGLVLAYFGGLHTGGEAGLADIAIFSGLGLMGGAMLRDFAIVATAYGVDLQEIKRSGLSGVVALLAGIFVSFIVGALVAVAFGYT
ncbi:MAG TPA: malonate transporter subunit MadM, partial [Candidatus Nesterenkonia stercoripullorum]|nr:malonate transporter subunit MadM [Candidatus Nesterenkonia stercoripullorum]